MMKASVFFGGTVFICLLFLNSSGLEKALTAVCSDDWLVARIKRRPFGNDTEIKVGDIHLGNNCSATRMLRLNYEFSYPVFKCGMKKILFTGSEAIIFSKIIYRPRLDTTYEFEVLCYMKRLLVPFKMLFGTNGYSVDSWSRSPQRAEEQWKTDTSPNKCSPDLGSESKGTGAGGSYLSGAHFQ